jgi:hypothetical protein
MNWPINDLNSRNRGKNGGVQSPLVKKSLLQFPVVSSATPCTPGNSATVFQLVWIKQNIKVTQEV